jgi:small subunit ribosomal protein S1
MKDRDVVLSRRKLLEREKDSARDQILESLGEGSTVQGRVTQVREFGAFVDLGGVDGLIPMRELSHDRVQRAEDVIAVGDVVEVKVTKIEPDGKRTKITLSLKALSADPWDGIETIAPVGRVVAGQVTKLADFGAFVRIASGVEGLLHISELGKEEVAVGQQLLVVTQKIALAQDGAAVGQAATSMKPVQGAVVKALVEQHERFGVFAQVVGTKGRAGRGLVPNAELGLPRGADVRKELPLGTEITAKVVDATEGRMRLSIRAAKDDAERAVYDSYREEQSKKGGMGTLGDLLKAKLSK